MSAASEGTSKGRSGRRPGDSGSRATILEVARAQFAAVGFAATTFRSVAAEARVDPALVQHFFGTKDELFQAALQFPPELPSLMLGALRGDPSEVGARLVRTYLGLWEDPRFSPALMAMFRSASTNEQAAGMFRTFVSARIGQDAPPVPDAQATISLALAHLIGIATARYIVRVEPIASMPIDELVDRLAPAMQALLGGGLHRAGTKKSRPQ